MKKTAVSPLTLLILCAGMVYNTSFFILKHGIWENRVPAAWIYFLFLNVLYAIMLITGKTARIRRIFFVTFAMMFFPAFIENLIIARGTMAFTAEQIAQAEIPFCHIVIPQTLITMALKRTVIFSGRLLKSHASVYSMLLIWLTASLAVGRGWCSWVCFYGGWDDGASRILRKKKLNLDHPDPRLRYMNFAVLLFVMLASLVTMASIYCDWLCPFKLITEYEKISGLRSYIAAMLFIVIFFGAVIILPILTRKRVQCTTLCPFGAFQSIVGKISPYRIKIDTEKCVSCMACVPSCPTLSLSRETIKNKTGRPHITCTSCMECIESCPQNAIKMDFRPASGKGLRRMEEWSERLKHEMKRGWRVKLLLFRTVKELLSAEIIFPFTALTLGIIVSSSFGIQTIDMFLKFTGVVQ